MNQQNNDHQAVLPRRSRRLGTIFIPASYWISMGYSEHDADLMVKLQTDMKKYSDGDYAEIKLCSMRYYGGVLPHHDLMLPHWKKLAKALEGRTSVEQQFLIQNNSLPVPVLDIVFPTLQTMNLETLTLFTTELGNDGFLRLSTFLRQNTSLVFLNLGGDTITDMSVANTFSDAIKNHSNLHMIMLLDCSLSNGTDILRIILEGCTRLPSLVLDMNNLRSEAAVLLADFIRNNHLMDTLELEHNNFSNDDTLLLASALKYNTNLNKLNLQKNNNITEEGEKTLLKAMFDPTSMDSIVKSNHTCLPYTYDIEDIDATDQRPSLEQELFNINGWETRIGKKIRWKVVLALCGVDGELFDLSYLNDLPIQLMPRVLELIQKHTEARTEEVTHTLVYHPRLLEKDALTRLFHTLRGWELPLLFENLSPKKETAGKRKKRKTRR